MFNKKYRSYDFCSRIELDSDALDRLISLFISKKIEKPNTVLAGRNVPIQTDIDGFGPVVVKHYTRGGLISYFNKQRYFFVKKTRGELEFEFLESARKAGVNAPKPFAYASYGGLFYKAWLITEKIENAQNFVEFCLKDEDILKDEDKALELLPAICDNINRLITASIFHRDLHPGNIVIGDSDRVFILDFDKAFYYSGDREKLKKKYRHRWQRAVKKYRFSDKLADLQL